MCNQIYQPKEEEEVKVEKESKEDLMKEYIAAAKRLDNATLVSLILLSPSLRVDLYLLGHCTLYSVLKNNRT